jgi:hypothetical protein
MKPHYKLVCDYVFSDKKVSEYSDCEQLTINLAIEVLTTHGMGGKFMETLIREKYRLGNDGKIHGWDGMTKQNRPVEIKTETVNASKKLFCEASFAPNTEKAPSKKNIFLKEKPILISSGLCNDTGKCIYVMFTDTDKLNRNSKMFDMLDRNSPRINFSHWCADTDAFEVKYKNTMLVDKHYYSMREELRKELKNVARLPF